MRLEEVKLGDTEESKRAVVKAYAGQMVIVGLNRNTKYRSRPSLVLGIIDTELVGDANVFRLKYREKGFFRKQDMPVPYSDLDSLSLVTR